MMISSFLSPALCRRFEMGLLLSVSLVALAAATIASCLSFDMVHLLLPRLVTGLASGGDYRHWRKLDHRRRGGKTGQP
jgi:MFS family permease